MVKFLIHRPIATLMTILGITIMGLLSMKYIPISLMPNIDIPEITVWFDEENMSARELEDAIVKPMRSSLMQTSHLKDIKSKTTNGSSVIKLSFTHGTSINYAFIEVNEKIDRAMSSLPRSYERPRVIKASATDIPVFYLNLTIKEKSESGLGSELDQRFIDFSQFANQVIRKRIEQLSEVALVDVSGLVYPKIEIIPDEQMLISLGLDLEDIESAINKEDFDIGSIVVKDNQYLYNLHIENSLRDINDLENIYIRESNRIYQLKDLARIKIQPQNRNGLILYNGNEAISMAIIKQSDARLKSLNASLLRTVDWMKKDYPDVDFSIVQDQTKLLNHAIGNLGQGLFWSISLAFLVMLLFLKDLKSSILIGIGIPVSILICLLCFHLLGLSINIISLSGLILGIGLMVDNSIIVIDNITQFRQRGETLLKACVTGTNEVFKPLLSSALTTCAVFLPLVFLSGITGALFYDQAVAISIGLFVSLAISITLLPVLYYIMHSKKGRINRVNKLLKKWNSVDFETLYEKGFHVVMKKQGFAIGSFIILLVFLVVLFIKLPKSQMPPTTTNEALIRIDWNEPITVDENKNRILSMVQLKGNHLLKEYNALIGHQQFLLDKNVDAKTSTAVLYIKTATQKNLEVLNEIYVQFIGSKYPSTIVEISKTENIFTLIFSEASPPLVAKLRRIGNQELKKNVHLEIVLDSIQNRLPRLEIQPVAWQGQIALLVDYEKLITYGITPSLLNNTLQSAFNEREILKIPSSQYFIPVILGNEEKSVSEVLQDSYLKANDSVFYSISEFVNETHIEGLKTITAGKEGEYYPIGFYIDENQKNFVIDTIDSIVDTNQNYNVVFTGSLYDSQEMIKELTIVFVITIFLLFFILASQFESLSLPLIILLEIPIAAAGALLLLYIFGMGINLLSLIGIVVMSGIIINDSILKIDTIIKLQRQGYSLIRALLVAGQRRLKPILMTSLTTILALLPILLTDGLGGELQAPLAVALIGGMLLGTFVSLYFIPLCYYHIEKKKDHVR